MGFVLHVRTEPSSQRSLLHLHSRLYQAGAIKIAFDFLRSEAVRECFRGVEV